MDPHEKNLDLDMVAMVLGEEPRAGIWEAWW